MALLRWKCRDCGFVRRMLVNDGSDMLGDLTCRNQDCGLFGEVMERDTGGSVAVVETRDNGAMTRKVERRVDAPDLIRDHADLKDRKDPSIV